MLFTSLCIAKFLTYIKFCCCLSLIMENVWPYFFYLQGSNQGCVRLFNILPQVLHAPLYLPLFAFQFGNFCFSLFKFNSLFFQVNSRPHQRQSSPQYCVFLFLSFTFNYFLWLLSGWNSLSDLVRYLSFPPSSVMY